MKRGKNLAQRLTLPQEVVSQGPLTELHGNTSVCIENHGGILEYTDTRVCIAVQRGTLTVSGGMIHGKSSYALEVVGGSAALSGGSYTTGVSDGCSIWNAGGTAADLPASGYRYQDDNGKESAYSEDGKGVVGNATVALRPANEYAYIDKNGNPAKQTNCTEITERTDDISTPGWYVVKENLTISSLNISGEVDLILCDEATLTVSNYMNVTAGSTLNLFWQSAGSGKLTAAISVLPRQANKHAPGRHSAGVTADGLHRKVGAAPHKGTIQRLQKMAKHHRASLAFPKATLHDSRRIGT